MYAAEGTFSIYTEGCTLFSGSVYDMYMTSNKFHTVTVTE